VVVEICAWTWSSGGISTSIRSVVKSGDTLNEPAINISNDKRIRVLEQSIEKIETASDKKRFVKILEKLKARQLREKAVISKFAEVRKDSITRSNSLAEVQDFMMDNAAGTLQCRPVVHVTVVKEETCFFVKPEKETLALGDTTLLYVKRSDGGVIPADQKFDIELIGPEGDIGALQVNGGTPSKKLIGVIPPITYIAPTSISEDSITVGFMVSKSVGTAASAKVPLIGLLKDSTKNLAKAAEPSIGIVDISSAQVAMTGCPLGGVTIKNANCPPGTQCDSPDPIVPKVTVVPKKSGEIEGENINCSNPDDKASFQTIRDDKHKKAFKYDEDKVSVCCNGELKMWVLQMPPFDLFAILDYCSKNLEGYHIIEPDQKEYMWQREKCDRCFALKCFNLILNDENIYPVQFYEDGYVIREMLAAHENIHKSDYQIDVDNACKKVFADKIGMRVLKKSYKTAESARKYFLGQGIGYLLKNLLQLANEKYTERTKTKYYDAADTKREKPYSYEQWTQRNQKVIDVLKDYKTNLKITDLTCRTECSRVY
jgi:hypothetical protein